MPADRSKTTGTDFLQLRADEAPTGGLSEWLAEHLRSAISDGRLPIGSRLPATRVLATDLRVSRGVVTEAYQRLTEDGHVAGRGRAGTVVVARPVGTTPVTPRPAASSAVATGRLFAAEPGVEIFEAMRAAPARIDLTPGVPDLAAFPRTAWLAPSDPSSPTSRPKPSGTATRPVRRRCASRCRPDSPDGLPGRERLR